ncbi:coatomer beta C-terminal region-domain-containing protein [Suillus ampliporus]|nr:coatomer beta C-terminal region-domain-containing protein [Suillus ampliporus]
MLHISIPALGDNFSQACLYEGKTWAGCLPTLQNELLQCLKRKTRSVVKPQRKKGWKNRRTKLVLRFEDLTNDCQKANALHVESKFITVPIDKDCNEHILNCIQTLSELQEKTIVHNIFLKDTKAAYSKMLVAHHDVTDEQTEKGSREERQFLKKSADDPIDYIKDLGKATGAAEVREDFISNLSHISQLTGFLDPIYAEAYIKMHRFDIFLDVLLVNQTPNTLQNLCLDFATLGDLKLSIEATIKVSSTETGVIFGSILWEGPALAECCVILNDIDIMDYIKPAYCSETQHVKVLEFSAGKIPPASHTTSSSSHKLKAPAINTPQDDPPTTLDDTSDESSGQFAQCVETLTTVSDGSRISNEAFEDAI